ncbi:tRNA (N(6)-L-threonylcarbamoyladenosine(37)-C(2))-methylthiotransferase [Candidatus Thorarchaeota archaeon]|nr:MAG: tRNA (N(6)-L-threonylcarbamoyladenosine(37)-C(2))-methylthiotransferase [Candidatus Thorarchaeota archaeon]
MTINFYLETYGCSLNSADSDVIVGTLANMDGTRVQSIDSANLIILNTCGVKEPTEDRIISRLEKLSTENIPVIVAGCLPKISLTRIEKAIPDFAAIIGPQSIESLIDVVPRVLKGEVGIVHLDSNDVSKLNWLEGPPNSVICTIPICEGCLGSCTYCAVRFARGSVRSHSKRDIFDTIEKCVRSGYREIRITSQDLGTYGTDIDSNLVDLVAMIDKIDGQHKFRLGMFNPNLVIDSIGELVRVMKSDHFFKFFHIPLQSGSDTILSSMQRKYTVLEWEQIVNVVRGTFNDSTIATDIIVGFPGETEQDFELTMDLIAKVRPPVVNISKYGDRPGTVASKAENKVDTSAKKNRSRRLTKLVNEILEENNKSWIGWTGEVIITEKGSRGGLMSRNSSYKPIIVNDDFELGDTVSIRIIEAERTHLFGETIS